MKPVDQTIVDPERGDCTRAVIASLFELDITQVPHVQLFGPLWFDVLYYFLMAIGYQYNGTGHPSKYPMQGNSINGYCYGVVKSRTYPGKFHAVVVDETGVVAHDPNPNKAWQGINVLETGDLMYYYLIGVKPVVTTGAEVSEGQDHGTHN